MAGERVTGLLVTRRRGVPPLGRPGLRHRGMPRPVRAAAPSLPP
jgi:hypothetical protein